MPGNPQGRTLSGEERYRELRGLISRVHAYGGLSHTPFCAKFAASQDNPQGPWDAQTAFPCDCGVDAIFGHMATWKEDEADAR